MLILKSYMSILWFPSFDSFTMSDHNNGKNILYLRREVPKLVCLTNDFQHYFFFFVNNFVAFDGISSAYMFVTNARLTKKGKYGNWGANQREVYFKQKGWRTCFINSRNISGKDIWGFFIYFKCLFPHFPKWDERTLTNFLPH